MNRAPPAHSSGVEWIVEALGCRPEALRSPEAVRALFGRAVAELALKPLAPPAFHVFPPPGGVTLIFHVAGGLVGTISTAAAATSF